jgi:hypothetical protein
MVAGLAALSAAPTARAQGILDFTGILGPQFVSYKIGSGTTERTVQQLSVPLVLIVPFGERFALDISTAYADSRVTRSGSTASSISGLTDTQLRANYTARDNVVFTFGANLPTGQYSVPDAQQEAAGQIGNTFLLYPVSSMGSGLAATGGFALAWALGEWNVGAGASYRHSTPFDAFRVQTSVLRFTPGDEVRARVGLDRPVGDGRFAVAATYSNFGDDQADSTTFATGGRMLGQLSYSRPLGGGDLLISGWDLYKGEGEQFGAKSPWENVANGSLAVGFTVGGLYVQPSVEGRAWQRDGEKAGTIVTGGLRFRFSIGALTINPAATYSTGSLYPLAGAEAVDVTGFRGSLLVRLR